MWQKGVMGCPFPDLTTKTTSSTLLGILLFQRAGSVGATQQGVEGGPWPTASELLRPLSLSPASASWVTWEVDPARLSLAVMPCLLPAEGPELGCS